MSLNGLKNSENKKVFKICLFDRVSISESFIEYKKNTKSPIKIPKNEVIDITVDALKGGWSVLRFMGKDNELGKVALPITYANKAQKWFLENLNK
jgi:hypothetical protein